MKPFSTLPLETYPSDENGYKLFRERIWHNGEICNSCFTRVRSIGPEMERQLETSKDGSRRLADGPPITIRINEWYERTTEGSQEHTTWDHNTRFGTCYCLNCGTDCNGNHRNKSLSELTPLVENIFRYVKEHTPQDIDGKAFGREVKQLKQQRSAQGHETEVMALAFARALADPRDEADDSGMAPATAD